MDLNPDFPRRPLGALTGDLPDGMTWDRLAAYVAGELASDEAAVVDRWARAESANAAVVEALRTAWNAESPLNVSESAARVQSTVMSVVREEHAATAGSLRERPRKVGLGRHDGAQAKPGRTMVAGIAVAVTAAVAAIVWSVSLPRNQPTAVAPAAKTYSTTNGQRSIITLPDGSRVWLNVASTLVVPVTFGSEDRTVKLDGEALFTVNHETGRPFTVTSGNATTVVLGTEFAVRHYATDGAVRVAVKSGRVRVGDVSLSAGEVARLTRSNGTTIRAGENVASLTSFSDGVLTLSDVTLEDAIPDLNRWYDADVEIGTPSLAGQRMVGALRGGSRADLVQILSTTFNAHVTTDGRTIRVYAR